VCLVELQGRWLTDIQPTTSVFNVSTVYGCLSSCMLTATREVNTEKQVPPKSDKDMSDWASVVRQIARQAERRTKGTVG
jgi:hypothetical protein